MEAAVVGRQRELAAIDEFLAASTAAARQRSGSRASLGSAGRRCGRRRRRGPGTWARRSSPAAPGPRRPASPSSACPISSPLCRTPCSRSFPAPSGGPSTSLCSGPRPTGRRPTGDRSRRPSCPSSARSPGRLPSSSPSTTSSGWTRRRLGCSSSRCGGWRASGSASSPPAGWARPGASFEAALRERGARRLQVGPLSVAALHEILRARLGRTFPRPTLVRIGQVSGGNPFFALEIARAPDERGGPVSGPIPIPDDLSALLR